MKTLRIIIVVITFSVSNHLYGQIDIKGNWICVDCPEGSLWHVKDRNRLVVEIAYPDTVIERKYQITDKDSLCLKEDNGKFICFGKLLQSTQDSFTIRYDTDQANTFINLPSIEPPCTKQDLIKQLSSSAWELNVDGLIYRMDFSSRPYDGDSGLPYDLLSSYQSPQPTREISFWNVIGDSNSLVLFSTNQIMDPIINRIISVSQDVIETEVHTRYHHGKVPAILKKVPTLDNMTKMQITETLITSPWKMRTYDTIYTGSKLGGISIEDHLDIEDLNSGGIVHKFKANGSYERLVEDQLTIHTTWELSPDGKFIWLGYYPNVWSLEIAYIDTTHLIIRSIEPVIRKNDRLIRQYQIEQNLIPVKQ